MINASDRFAAAVADRYRIERELGQGGMATVFLAHDIRHERKVAIKLLREDLAASMGSGRFLREIQIAAQLQHPNILPLLESGDTDGFLYYVMPFVAGQSLRERLGREGELPVHEAVRLLVEVTDALAHAHQHGVVHRDIKPDNVMLSGRHALVADFGVAKAISEATGRNTVTTLGVAVGTPAYMSPEQAAADPHIDHRSDIYAVGVMAYEMLTGRPPFTGSTPQQVLAAHVTEAPDSVAKRRPAIPPQLEQAVMRCLAKRPADRFQSAEELLHELEALSTPGSGITPTQTRPISGYTTPTPRRRWIVPAVAGVVVLALVAAWQFRSRSPAPVRDVARVQATNSGAAESGALSPDGQRVAYSERECDQQFRCTVTLVIQDIGGVGRLRAATGFAGIYRVGWSPDGRRVSMLATDAGGRFGTFVLPSLGGDAPRFLGPLDALFFAGGDSLMVLAPTTADPIFIVRHALDERGGDTVPVRLARGTDGSWAVTDDGRMLAFAMTSLGGGRFVRMYDRAGQVLDSLGLGAGESVIGFAPSGSLVLERRDSSNRAIASIIEREVSRSGKVGRNPRLLLAPQLMVDPRVSAAGVSYLAGPVESGLYDGSRPAEMSADLTIRKVTGATTGITTLMSGDGQSHIVMRLPPSARRSEPVRISVIPFGGGPERQLSAGIRGVIDRSRTVAADAIVFVHHARNQARITSFDLATGRTTDLGTMPDTSEMTSMEVLRDGSIAWTTPGDITGQIKVRNADGSVRTIATPNVIPNTMEDSQFGDGIVGWGWNRAGDSAIVFHASPGAPTARRLLQLGVENMLGLRWARRGMIELVVGETAHTSAFYRLDPATGAFTRIGTVPLNDATAVSFSLDGLHMGFRTEEARRDVWVAKVFN